MTEFCFGFCFVFISEMIVDHQIETGLLKPDLKDKVTYTLLRKHRHQTKKSNLRSLADIGKTVSTASRMFSSPDNGNAGPHGCCSFLPASLTLLHLLSPFFSLNPSSYFFFSQLICHNHFIMTHFNQLGRFAVLLEGFQQLL